MCDKLLEILWGMEYLRSTIFYTFLIILKPEEHRRINYFCTQFYIFLTVHHGITLGK